MLNFHIFFCKDKKLNFKIENFSKFKKKIHYLVVDDLPINVKSPKKNWHENHGRDQFQRNAMERGYRDFSGEDLIMISDIDEIPNPKKLGEFNIKNKYACFLQKNFQSKINLLNITDGNWPGTKICQKKYLKSPQWLRNIKDKKYSFFRFDILFSNKKYSSIKFIQDGGWHFSNIKNAEEIKFKLKSYLHHREFDVNPMTTEEIEEIIENKQAIYDLKVDKRVNKIGDGSKLEKYSLNKLPKFLQDNYKNYQECSKKPYL